MIFILARNILGTDYCMSVAKSILFRKPNLDDIIVSDFGLADFQNSEGLYKYHRCGTPGNIAPEVLKDQPYDFKVDTYSAGIIFY